MDIDKYRQILGEYPKRNAKTMMTITNKVLKMYLILLLLHKIIMQYSRNTNYIQA